MQGVASLLKIIKLGVHSKSRFSVPLGPSMTDALFGQNLFNTLQVTELERVICGKRKGEAALYDDIHISVPGAGNITLDLFTNGALSSGGLHVYMLIRGLE